MHVILMFLLRNVEQLEHNPRAQYSFNRLFAIFWFLFAVAIFCVPSLYAHSVANLIIEEATIWGCFATHFGAMSSALAAIGTRKQQSISLAHEKPLIRPERAPQDSMRPGTVIKPEKAVA